MSDQEVWEVVDIVDKRIRNNVEEFKIRWAGCNSDSDSWEPESNCLPSSYGLIKKLEKTLFQSALRENRKKFEIIGLRFVGSKIKLYVEWKGTKTQQYFYSSVIRNQEPHILINFYEEHVRLADQDDEIDALHYYNTVYKNKETEIDESDEPLEIVAAAPNGKGGRLFLITWNGKSEASIVDEAYVKKDEKCITLLVRFYEKYLLTDAPTDIIVMLPKLSVTESDVK